MRENRMSDEQRTSGYKMIKEQMLTGNGVPLFSVPVETEPNGGHEMERPRKLFFLNDYPVFEKYEGCNTMHDNLISGCSYGENRKLAGKRVIKKNGKLGKYIWYSYGKCYNLMCTIASGLIAYGIKPKDYVLGINRNNVQWFLFYHANAFNSIIHVFLQDNTSTQDLFKKLKVVSDIPYLAMSVLAAEIVLGMPTVLKNIKKVIIFTEYNKPQVEKIVASYISHGIECISFEDLIELGRKYPSELHLPNEDDVAMVLFTSGTTADATGVKMTHRNLMCSVLNSVFYAKKGFHIKISKRDRIVSYLPMAHVIEISSHLSTIHTGGCIGFYSGDMDNFLNDVSVLHPTLFVSVPRFFNVIYKEVSNAITNKSSLSASIFKKAYVSALKSKNAINPLDYIYRKLAFTKIKSILGGNVKLIILGSASIEPDIMKFFSVCFSCPFIETYGLTESCGLITMSMGIPETDGTVGPPSCAALIKIVNAQPLRTYLESGTRIRGEICVKGGMMCKSFYNKDDACQLLRFDDDGWFHTGDIGYWTETGLLKIMDRKVNIVPLKNGTVIFNESIEAAFSVCTLIDAYICYASPGLPYAVGVAFLNVEALRFAEASRPNLKFDSLEAAIESPDFRSFIKAELDEFICKSGLVPCLVCKHIYFESKDIRSLDLYTPSLKIKRHIVCSLYKDVFDKFFNEYYSSSQLSPESIPPPTEIKKKIPLQNELVESIPLCT